LLRKIVESLSKQSKKICRASSSLSKRKSRKKVIPSDISDVHFKIWHRNVWAALPIILSLSGMSSSDSSCWPYHDA
jgi:hypothetical protein